MYREAWSCSPSSVRTRRASLHVAAHVRPGPVCLFSGLERDKFDNKTVTFEEHIQEEHNMWHYLCFIVLVKVKDSTEYTGPESYVAEMIKVGGRPRGPGLGSGVGLGARGGPRGGTATSPSAERLPRPRRCAPRPSHVLR